ECRTEGAAVRPRAPGVEPLVLLRLTPKVAAVGRFLELNRRIEEVNREVARRRRGGQEAGARRVRLLVQLASAGGAGITTDPAGRVALLTPVAEALTGWAREEAAGKPLEEVFRIINELSRGPADDPVARALREGVVVGLANHTL